MSESIINILIVVLVVIIGAVASLPPVRGTRESANRAVCQKTMAAVESALEMAIIDGECIKSSSLKEAIPLLVKKGYLSCLQTEPGLRITIDTWYKKLPDGRLFCINHGICGVEKDCGLKSPRQQLVALQVDTELLDVASTRVLAQSHEFFLKKRAQIDERNNNIIKLCGGWLLILFVYSFFRASAKKVYRK